MLKVLVLFEVVIFRLVKMDLKLETLAQNTNEQFKTNFTTQEHTFSLKRILATGVNILITEGSYSKGLSIKPDHNIFTEFLFLIGL